MNIARLIFLFLFSHQLFARADEQVYVIDPNDVYGPVKSKYSDQVKTEKVLKNPDANAKVHSSQIVQREKKKNIAQNKPAQEFIPKKLRFKAMKVGGRKADPRLQFSQDPIQLQRADEPLAVDFYKKIFDENKLEY